MLLDTLAGLLRVYMKVYGLDMQTAIRELRGDALTITEATADHKLAHHTEYIIMQAHREWVTGPEMTTVAPHRYHKEVIHP